MTIDDIFSKNVKDKNTRGQFHQYITCNFCVDIFAPKKYKPSISVQKSFEQNFRTKKPRIKCWWNWHQEKSDIRRTFKIGAKIVRIFLVIKVNWYLDELVLLIWTSLNITNTLRTQKNYRCWQVKQVLNWLQFGVGGRQVRFDSTYKKKLIIWVY